MNDEDLRDCFAMFAMIGLVARDKLFDAEEAWFVADKMLEARKPKEEGIVAIKRKVKIK
jgi:hypothetical protein